MSTKLTLSIDGAVIRQAKAFARQRRKSLSKLVEEYLRFVSADAGHAPPISNRVLAFAETLDMPPGVSDDDLREQYLREKLPSTAPWHARIATSRTPFSGSVRSTTGSPFS